MANRGMKGVDLAIGIMLIIIVAAAVLPDAFDDWFAADTTGWPGMMDSLWELVPLFAILALALFMYRKVDA